MNLDVVIVTYNRLEKLKKTLECYENQTASFRNLIIVNNCSTDGSKEFLEDWKVMDHPFSVHLLHLNSNTGGSGGFCTGQKYAMTLNPDWLLIADDDAYPRQNAVELFYEFEKNHRYDHLSAICSSVYDMNGNPILRQRRYLSTNPFFFKEYYTKPEEYNKEYFEIQILSYVGAFLNCDAIRTIGFVNPNYFIYFDDTEHSLRLLKYGRIMCVPSIVFKHDCGADNDKSSDIKISWREYYSRRNQMHMLIRYRPAHALFEAVFTIIKHPISFIRIIINGSSVNPFFKIKYNAYKDAWTGKLGINDFYKPGWFYK